MTPRRSVYGDQGEEVAWEVEQQESVETKCEYQEARKHHEVSRPVGGIGRRVVEHVAERLEQALGVLEEWKFLEQQAERKHIDS